MWFVTGASSGFGLELVRSALTRGDKAIAIVRASSSLDELNKLQLDAGESNLHILELDVTDTQDKIENAAKTAIAVWGKVDVIVNNAGYVTMQLCYL